MKKVLRLVQIYVLSVIAISIFAIWSNASDIWHYVLALSTFLGLVSLQIKAE